MYVSAQVPLQEALAQLADPSLTAETARPIEEKAEKAARLFVQSCRRRAVRGQHSCREIAGDGTGGPLFADTSVLQQESVRRYTIQNNYLWDCIEPLDRLERYRTALRQQLEQMGLKDFSICKTPFNTYRADVVIPGFWTDEKTETQEIPSWYLEITARW